MHLRFRTWSKDCHAFHIVVIDRIDIRLRALLNVELDHMGEKNE